MKTGALAAHTKRHMERLLILQENLSKKKATWVDDQSQEVNATGLYWLL